MPEKHQDSPERNKHRMFSDLGKACKSYESFVLVESVDVSERLQKVSPFMSEWM